MVLCDIRSDRIRHCEGLQERRLEYFCLRWDFICFCDHDRSGFFRRLRSLGRRSEARRNFPNYFIVFGFLIYIAIAKLDHVREAKPSVRWAVPILLVCSMAAAAVTYLATTGNLLSERAFPYVVAAMGISAVVLAHRAEFLFTKRKRLSNFSRYLGGISYSVYLFHILLVMLLKPRLQNVDLIWQLLVYLSCLVLLSSVFWIYFEKPILAARPKYRDTADLKRQAGLVSQT